MVKKKSDVPDMVLLGVPQQIGWGTIYFAHALPKKLQGKRGVIIWVEVEVRHER